MQEISYISEDFTHHKTTIHPHIDRRLRVMIWCEHTIAGGGFVSVDYTLKEYQDLVESYSKEPRDVHTIPLNREPIWFFTYVEKGFVYVRPSCINKPSSRMKDSTKTKSCRI